MGSAEALNEGKNEEKTDTCTGKLESGGPWALMERHQQQPETQGMDVRELSQGVRYTVYSLTRKRGVGYFIQVNKKVDLANLNRYFCRRTTLGCKHLGGDRYD